MRRHSVAWHARARGALGSSHQPSAGTTRDLLGDRFHSRELQTPRGGEAESWSTCTRTAASTSPSFPSESIRTRAVSGSRAFVKLGRCRSRSISKRTDRLGKRADRGRAKLAAAEEDGSKQAPSPCVARQWLRSGTRTATDALRESKRDEGAGNTVRSRGRKARSAGRTSSRRPPWPAAVPRCCGSSCTTWSSSTRSVR